MKRLNITLPDKVYHLLISHVGKGKISSYLANLALEDLSGREEKLADAYSRAADSRDRQKLLDEWKFDDSED